MFPAAGDVCVPCYEDQPSSCQECESEAGEACDESETFLIIGQFEKLYKNRLAEVEAGADATGAHVTELKLKIMTDWVEDLGEQNKMLVKTVHELEKAAISRVKLLENKLHETSTMVSHNMSQTEDDQHEEEQIDMQRNINNLQSDVTNLLKLIKRGREENNWSLEGMQFCSIDSSDIPNPTNCSCYQIGSVSNNEERALIEKLRYELLVNKEEHKVEVNNLLMNIDEKYKEIERLVTQFTFSDKEKNPTEVHENSLNLTEELAQKNDLIHDLKNTVARHENTIKDLLESSQIKDYVICKLKNKLKRELMKNCDKTTAVGHLCDTTAKQLQDLNNLLILKDKGISELVSEGAIIHDESKEAVYKTDTSSHADGLTKKQAALTVGADIITRKDDIHRLKIENENVLKLLKNVENIREFEVTVGKEKLQDLIDYIYNYKANFTQQNPHVYNVTEFIGTVETKIIYIQNLIQKKCEICAKENLLSDIKEIILKVASSICSLLEVYENNNICSNNKTKKNNDVYCKDKTTEFEQKAIFAVMLQQFRMMEEFRVCTVEVQAATEDLKEEVSLVITNLNSRHSKYIELRQMVNLVHDYLTKTTGNICDVINRLELQDEERIRHNERITNNRVRLKDIKNEFNHVQLELSKCHSNVHNNIEQTNLLGCAEVYTCNNLLITLVEEIEQIVSNMHNFQSQGCLTLTTLNELRKQLTLTEHGVKEFKRKSDQLLMENEVAQTCFTQRLNCLEKYECEVDNSHTKMQDVLENIIAIRNQMNKFGVLGDTECSYENVEETISLKDNLRRLQKEFEELKHQTSKESCNDKRDEVDSSMGNKVIELQDEIQLLKTEIKCKQEANVFLKQNIGLLEKEMSSVRAKAENHRKCFSSENYELKRQILEFENYLSVKKDTENNLNCLGHNDMDLKKLQHFDYINKDQLYGSSIHGLQSENVPQLLKALQASIQTVKFGLQDLSDEFKKLVSEDLSRISCSSALSMKKAIDTLTKYIECIKTCLSEVDKIKGSICSKNKLMENMDEIIRIQKDSILISQLEVEKLHKTLQEKINVQEKSIYQCEQEKRQLHKQAELHVQTINHLQEAVVEAKRTIDQLNKKATSDASKQSAILDIQRDSISALQKKTNRLEYNELLYAFMLYFIYYIVIFKYQQDLEEQEHVICDMKLKMNELLNLNNIYEKENTSLQCKYEEAIEDINALKIDYQESRAKLYCEKQSEIDKLTNERNELKKQCQVNTLDLNLIQEEMKKMGIAKPTVDSFKAQLENIRAENRRFRCDNEQYQKTINKLRLDNETLKTRLCESKRHNSDNNNPNKLSSHCLQNEIIQKNERINNHCANNDSISLRLREENEALKKNNDAFKKQMDELEQKFSHKKCILEQQLKETKCQFAEMKVKYERALQESNKNCINSKETICCPDLDVKKENKRLEEIETVLTKELEIAKQKLEKFENFERLCQRQKDEIMLLKKKLSCANQQVLNSNVVKEEMIRQNKLFEENNSKSMAELEDIAVQLGEMQNSLARLQSQCDAKSQSLDFVAEELAKMKKNSAESSEESKQVLNWVRVWIRQQKHITTALQEKLYEKQQQLVLMNSEKKKLVITMKQLIRDNKILTKGLKLVRQSANKQHCGKEYILPLRQINNSIIKQKDRCRNGFYSPHSNHKQSNAVYSHFKRECRQKRNFPENKIRIQGDHRLFSALEYLTEKVPKTSQTNENRQIDKRTKEERSDYGYQTSSSK